MKNYSINEIAKIFNITTNKIRFYEKKGLLKPKRVEVSDYRSFDDSDVLKLQSILLYRSIRLSIADIEEILKNKENEQTLSQFTNQWQLVNDEIHRLTSIRESLSQILDKLYEEKEISAANEAILEIISSSNSQLNIKNNWKDRWNFDSWAKTYDASVKKNIGRLKIYKNYEPLLEEVYESTRILIPSGAELLDIGVGTGNLAGKFLDAGYAIVGIDQSREMLAEAKKKYPALKLRLGEFLKIPFADNSFDAIVSSYAFHHLNAAEKIVAIEEMLRVLKPSGCIVIGDMMFRNEAAKLDMMKSLTIEQIAEIEDEYYSDIEVLESEFKKHRMRLTSQRIDEITHIITICADL